MVHRMNLSSFILSQGFTNFEGNCSTCKQEIEILIKLTHTDDEKPINVMEIGFNAGNSAEVFLHNNNNLILTSFDIGEHDYVQSAKSYIDAVYPNRHTLILGDSRLTVPEFIKANNVKFDVIFIDGGHDYDIAKKDMENCMKLAHKDTIVILDDVVYTENLQCYWNAGPTRVWKEFVQDNKIIQIDKGEFNKGIGVAHGKYNI